MILTEIWLISRRVNPIGEVFEAPLLSEIPFAKTKASSSQDSQLLGRRTSSARRLLLLKRRINKGRGREGPLNNNRGCLVRTLIWGEVGECWSLVCVIVNGMDSVNEKWTLAQITYRLRESCITFTPNVRYVSEVNTPYLY